MRILVATDGSDFSRAAIEKCCQIIAKPETTQLKIVSVYQDVLPVDAFPQSAEYAEQQESAGQAKAEQYAREAAALFEECFPNSGVVVTTQVSDGAPDTVMIETAKQWKADMIVVGSHGRGFLKRLLVGSVTDALVHHAPCSVLVVRRTTDTVETDIREII